MKPCFSLRTILGSLGTLLLAAGMTGCVSPGNNLSSNPDDTGGQWVLQPKHSGGTVAGKWNDPGRWRSVVSPMGDAPGERDLDSGSPWGWQWVPTSSSASGLAAQ